MPSVDDMREAVINYLTERYLVEWADAPEDLAYDLAVAVVLGKRPIEREELRRLYRLVGVPMQYDGELFEE